MYYFAIDSTTRMGYNIEEFLNYFQKKKFEIVIDDPIDIDCLCV
jgi:hypothetical protein